MVFCTVEAFGKSRTAQLPVMDFRNKAIHNPDAFAVNTAMQRCLAKAISLHGLGMYIYAGEDLPQEDTEKKHEVEAPKQSITPIAGALDNFTTDEKDSLSRLAEEITFFVKNDDLAQAFEVTATLNNDEKTAVWSLLDSKTRSKFKKG
jgi:hypothetical protein